MVLEVAVSQGYQIECCLAATPEINRLLGVRVELESKETIQRLQAEGMWGFVAVGSNSLRRKLQNYLVSLNVRIPVLVSKHAYVSPSCSLGAGTVVMPGAAIGAASEVGVGAILNTSSSVDHDCKVGDYSHIGPGTHLAGNVVVKSEAFLGVGVSVVPEKAIGEKAIVGAGGVVLSDVPNDQVWVGTPAKFLKQRSS